MLILGVLYICRLSFSPSVDWAEAQNSHFWREGPFVRAQALGDGQHDANDAHYFFHILWIFMGGSVNVIMYLMYIYIYIYICNVNMHV